MPEVDLDIELPEGVSERGRNRALKYGCYGCHVNAPNGLSFEAAEGLPGITERGDVRIADPAYEGRASTNREYILESILLPEIYIVPGDWGDAMPTYLGDRMTEQELADIMAWLDTLE